jgi:hypothetical protein
MSRLEIVSLQEAMANTATGRRAKITHEYLGYIAQLQPGQAGKMAATADESATAIRRRLGAAAKLAGIDLTIKRNADEVYFWLPARKRGRPRKTNFPLG